jgi:tetratricopeptide (TPR) repeat protein
MTDIFSVQDDVASAIIAALQIHVGAVPTRGRPTENPEAYALFLQGRAAMNRYEALSATQFLRDAVELDPKFSEAHELLAFTYWFRGSTTLDAAESYEGIYTSARSALALDPNLALAHALFLDTEADVYSPQLIEAYAKAAASGGSNQWAATEILTYILLEAGYFQEALGVIERLVANDPLSPAAHTRLAQALEAVGRRNEALAALKLADQLGGNTTKPELFHFYLEDKRDENAILIFEAFLKEGEAGTPTGWVGDLVAGGRNSATGQAHLDRRVPQILASMPEIRVYEMRQILTRLYLRFGFLDRYFELLDELGTTTAEWNDAEDLILASTIKRDSGFTTHPRYLEIAEKYAYGMVSLWDVRGAPDHCEKLDGQWVCE